MRTNYLFTAFALATVAASIPENPAGTSDFQYHSLEPDAKRSLTQELDFSSKRDLDPSSSTTTSSDKREDVRQGLSNNIVYSGCASVYVRIANMRLHAADSLPNMHPTNPWDVPIIGQSLYDGMRDNIAGGFPIGGIVNTGFTGGFWAFQVMRGSHRAPVVGAAFAAIFRDAVARLYIDQRPGMTFSILDDVGRVLYTISLIMVSSTGRAAGVFGPGQ